jgi:predicted ATPase
MIGREEELQQLESLLRVYRLVTIVGSGGVGKTRLAEAVGERRARADSILWVDLASVSDPALLANALSLAAGIDSGSGADPLSALLAEWNGSIELIILDNAEHVLEAVVELARRLLNELATARILITSQAPLRIAGEQVYRLEALALPAIGIADVAAALRCPSLSLFMSRVRAASRNIELTAQNLSHVIDICRWLDGIPLALDLAAARVAQFGIEQVAQRLQESLQLLRSTGAGRPPRQQTLRAAYEWSYGLLTQPEQAAFRRLGVFVGAFPLQSAARVIAQGSADEWDALDRLGALVDRSLVWLEPGEPPTYRLPESGRQFALEHLQVTRETSAIAIVADEYERAGDAATSRSANAEAVANYSAALATTSLLPDPAQTTALELRLHLKLGPAVQAALSPASPRCESIYRRSVELARRTGDQHELFRAQWGYWQYLCLVGRDREAAEYADALVVSS